MGSAFPRPANKKLIYLLNSYSEDDSSHFHHILGLVQALASRGIVVTLLIEKATSIPAFRSRNISVVALQNRTGPLRFIELFVRLVGLIRQGYTRTFVRISAPAALTAVAAHWLFGGSVFLWQSGTTHEFDARQPPTLKKLKWFIGSYLPNAAARRLVNYFVTGPQSMVNYYSNVLKVRPDKIRLLFNDVDTSRFAKPGDAAARKGAFLTDHGYEPDALILLLVHRLSPVRRTSLYFPKCLLNLAKSGLLSKVVTVVAGAGPDLGEVRAEAKRLDVDKRCIFLGNIPNREIQGLYAIADIFLHPTYNEGFPRVVLEAMAAGLPLVSTDAGGTRELLGSGQLAFVVPREDADAFGARLETLVRNGPLRRTLSHENLSSVQRFSTPTVASMYEQVLFA